MSKADPATPVLGVLTEDPMVVNRLLRDPRFRAALELEQLLPESLKSIRVVCAFLGKTRTHTHTSPGLPASLPASLCLYWCLCIYPWVIY